MKKLIYFFVGLFLLVGCTVTTSNRDLILNYYNGSKEVKKSLEDKLLAEYEIVGDKFKQTKYYRIKRPGLYILQYYDNPVLIYGGSDTNSKFPTFLRMEVKYRGNKFLFADKITFLYDNNKVYSIDLSKATRERDYTLANIATEKYDVALTNAQIRKLEEIMKSEKVEYRLSGRDSHDSYIYKDDALSNLGLIKLYLEHKK